MKSNTGTAKAFADDLFDRYGGAEPNPGRGRSVGWSSLGCLNDPLIGWLSDRTRFRWGRRYPWRLLMGCLPAVLLGGGIYCADQYPLSRDGHIRKQPPWAE